MTRTAFTLSLLAALGLPAGLLAHEGHAHKLMGTVSAIDASHVEIDTKDGKRESVSLAKETRYLKGKASATPADLKVGDRVVLTVTEHAGKKTATEVLLAAGSPDKATAGKP